MKNALAIYGDGFHSSLPLHASIGGALEKCNYTLDTVIDFDIPYDHFRNYDLIVISRYKKGVR